MYGRSSHHKIEAVFKAFARALRVACAKDKRLATHAAVSTKGCCERADRKERSVIALIDYGAGNLTSVKKALAAIDADVFVPASPDDMAEATGVIVPGVGHFGATRALDAEWIAAILGALGEGRPLLGICLGMQWLFEGSDEAPDLPGPGRPRRARATACAADAGQRGSRCRMSGGTR